MKRSVLLVALFLPAATSEAQESEVTFTEHVAPIVFASCVSCHRPEQAAPFSLLSYRDVRRKGRMIEKVTRTRFMPPWHPVPGHGDFRGELRLTDAEIDTISRWVEAGMPEGPAEKLPPLPEFPSGWYLGEPDLVVSMAEAFPVPADGSDVYRNFCIPLDLPQDEWVTAIEVRPSARSVVHHILFFLDDSGEARRREAADGLPGFRGMGSIRRQGDRLSGWGQLGGWAVGGLPVHLPEGMGQPLPAGSDLVLQTHFHPSGKAEREKTTLGLYFAKEKPRHTLVPLQLPPGFGIAAGLDIPAGKSDFALRDSVTVPVDVRAITVGGHAHYLCTTMKATATLPDGSERPLFYIDDWDFNWQNRYMYREPVGLPAGTRIDVEISYDNSSDNPDNPFDPPRRVRWGRESTDEMGSVTLYVVPADEGDLPQLQRSIRAQALRSMLRGNGARTQRWVEQLRRLDADGDGRIARDEVPRRYGRLFDLFDVDRDGFLSGEELDMAAGGRRER